MSTSGLTNEYNPPTLDGLTVIEADQVYIGGQEVNVSNLVPYTGANQTVDLGNQIIRTTHTATTNPELVNLGLLNTTISNLSIAIAGSFLDKTTATPQTVAGNVSYTAQLSADDLLVPSTKKASLGSVLTVDANYRRSETDATVSTVQYFGSISSSMGIYQATSTQNFAILQVADLGAGTGKRMDINWNLNINEPSYNSSIQLFASDNGTTINQYLGPSVSFTPSDPLYKVMTGTFVPVHRYICVLCITSKPGGVQTVRWYGLQLEEQGVELTNVTMSAQGANQIPIINDKKQLVGSGVSSSKVVFLDNCSEDIQTALNNRLKLDGSNANQDIVLGGYKVQSSATPTTGNDLTNKSYVDGAISGAGTLYLLKTGGTMTGDIMMNGNKVTSSANPSTDDTLTRKGYVDTQDGLRVLKAGDTMTATLYNSGGDFHAYRGGDTNRGCILTANNADGATYASNNGGLASWFGISFKSTYDNTTRFVFNTRDGNSSQTGTMKADAVNVDGQTASKVCIFDASKNIISSSVSSATLGYLDITSSLTSLLNTKGNLSGGNTWSDTQTFNGTVAVSNRLLGEPDGSSNFWIGLRGSSTEANRLAISIIGESITGIVDKVIISKNLRLTAPTANRVLTLNSSGDVVSSSITPSVLEYLDIGSSLTSLLNLKANLAGPQTFTNTHTFNSATPINLSAFTGDRVLTLDASKNLSFSSTTTTELGYLSGVSSGIQNQINGKVSKSGDTMSGALTISTTAFAPFTLTRTSAGTNFGVGTIHSLVSPLNFQGFYARSFGGSDGAVATSAQSQCNGYYALDVANAGVFASDVDPTTSSFYISKNGARFNVAGLGIGGASKTGVQLKLADSLQNRKIVLFDGGYTDDHRFYGFGIMGNTLRFSIPDASTDRFSFFSGAGSSGATSTEVFRINGTGALESGVSGANANTTANLKMASSASHINNSAGEVYLFTALNGHLGIQRNTTRNATTACLALGTTDTEESQVISYKADGSGYMPLSYAGSKHTLVGGPVNIAGASPYAVPQGYMATGSLTLGSITNNYGGGNNWTANTAGLLMECLDSTEIAIHDSGQRVASFCYFQGGSTNTFTIGRDMGWGTTPLIINSRLQCNSNVGIGTTNPTGRLMVYDTTSDYTNNIVLKQPWPGLLLDNTHMGGREWCIFNGGSGAGIGQGNFGIFDKTANAYRFSINSTGQATFHSWFKVENGDISTCIYGPNTTWNARLRVGSATSDFDATTAQIISTSGSLHLDAGYSKHLYLNYYQSVNGQLGNTYSYGSWTHTGNLTASTYSAVNATVNTYQNMSNRLLFRDGSGALTVGACSFWQYTNDSIAWTYGTVINNAFYVPSTTATIQIDITGSGYGDSVGHTTFYVSVYTGAIYYNVYQKFFFNYTYQHTQMTQHITIPPNTWGAATIGYKNIAVSWNYSVGYVSSDGNDTLQFKVSVIG